MASHHFIGTGLVSEDLTAAVEDSSRGIGMISDLVESSGLSVAGSTSVDFDGGGLTLVWVLAESHLVLHFWRDEGYATIDLHVCDYRESNAHKAHQLVELLKKFCFIDGSDRWHELQLEPPATAAVPAES